MSKEQQLKVVYTYIYWYSLDQIQTPKIMYYKNRSIDLKNRWLEKIGYIGLKEFDSFLKGITKIFPLDVLEEVGVVKYDEKNNVKLESYKLSWHYVKKGGIMLIPSFDLYTNMVTGFMLRPTHPEKWMKEKGMKEIQLSNTYITPPLPFGITYDVLKNNNEIRFTEGHPDSLAFAGNTNTENEVAFASIPGVNGLHIEHLGLFKGKLVVICFDQDQAGQKAAYGYHSIDINKEQKIFIKEIDDAKFKKELETCKKSGKEYKLASFLGVKELLTNAGVTSFIKNWDKAYGSDVNEVRINGNIKELFN